MTNQATNTEEATQLKFEGFKTGQVIKAYDFEPRTFINDGVLVERDEYVIGRIKKITKTPFGAKGYLIDVMKDSVHEEGGRTEVFVPMEIAMSDYEGRVTLIEETYKGR